MKVTIHLTVEIKKQLSDRLTIYCESLLPFCTLVLRIHSAVKIMKTLHNIVFLILIMTLLIIFKDFYHTTLRSFSFEIEVCQILGCNK